MTPGPKAGDPDHVATIKVSIRFSPDERRALEQAAAENHCSLSALLREGANCLVQDYREGLIFLRRRHIEALEAPKIAQRINHATNGAHR